MRWSRRRSSAGLKLITVGRNGDGIRLARRRDRRLRAGRHASSTRASVISSACRWSAASRSRTRWSRPGSRSRPAASRIAVFAALASLKGAKGRLDLVGDAQRRAGVRRLRPQARRAGKGARGAAALRQAPARRGVRRRRRPRQGQAAADGRDRGREAPTASSSPTTIRAARIRPRSAPPSWRLRRARVARSATAARRSAARSRRLQPGDVLLIAGKGHETGQIVGDRTLPFSDHDEVEAALREKVA